ncbi:MAG: hypothetical protein E7309_04700 [Butyrivibrio sp.]|nr:hypothetical protein [Butyrivibrio sp.]
MSHIDTSPVTQLRMRTRAIGKCCINATALGARMSQATFFVISYDLVIYLANISNNLIQIIFFINGFPTAGTNFFAKLG